MLTRLTRFFPVVICDLFLYTPEILYAVCGNPVFLVGVYCMFASGNPLLILYQCLSAMCFFSSPRENVILLSLCALRGFA